MVRKHLMMHLHVIVKAIPTICFERALTANKILQTSMGVVMSTKIMLISADNFHAYWTTKLPIPNQIFFHNNRFKVRNLFVTLIVLSFISRKLVDKQIWDVVANLANRKSKQEFIFKSFIITIHWEIYNISKLHRILVSTEKKSGCMYLTIY